MLKVFFKSEAFEEGENIGKVWILDPEKITGQIDEKTPGVEMFEQWMSKSQAREIAKQRGLEFYDEEEEWKKVPEIQAVLDRFDAHFAEADKQKQNE